MADFKAVGQYEYAEGITLRMPYQPPSCVDKLKTFQFEKGDVLIASYPKCGNTWAAQIVTSILSNGDTDTEIMKKDIHSRVQYMELQVSSETPANVDLLAKTPAPRVMKTHLPAQIYKQGLEDGKGKFIVVMRNPKDCIVSYYNFYRAMKSLGHFSGKWEDFFELFKAKSLLDGDWLYCNLGWWNERHRDNVLVLKYEDMKKDLKAAILKLASFCGTPLSDDVIEKIVGQSTFDSMKSNPLANIMTSMPASFYDHDVSPFFRKGTVGDWQNVFTEEQNAFVDEHYTAVAAKQGLLFDFSI